MFFISVVFTRLDCFGGSFSLFGDIRCRDVCSFSNIMEVDGPLKNSTAMILLRKHNLATRDNPHTLLRKGSTSFISE